MLQPHLQLETHLQHHMQLKKHSTLTYKWKKQLSCNPIGKKYRWTCEKLRLIVKKMKKKDQEKMHKKDLPNPAMAHIRCSTQAQTTQMHTRGLSVHTDNG
jgi:hypothetical protein